MLTDSSFREARRERADLQVGTTTAKPGDFSLESLPRWDQKWLREYPVSINAG